MMDLKVTALPNKFIDADFQQLGDAVKMTLVLFVESFFFESDYKKVSLYLFSLVEKLDQFNSFPFENMCTR